MYRPEKKYEYLIENRFVTSLDPDPVAENRLHNFFQGHGNLDIESFRSGNPDIQAFAAPLPDALYRPDRPPFIIAFIIGWKNMLPGSIRMPCRLRSAD